MLGSSWHHSFYDVSLAVNGCQIKCHLSRLWVVVELLLLHEWKNTIGCWHMSSLHKSCVQRQRRSGFSSWWAWRESAYLISRAIFRYPARDVNLAYRIIPNGVPEAKGPYIHILHILLHELELYMKRPCIWPTLLSLSKLMIPQMYRSSSSNNSNNSDTPANAFVNHRQDHCTDDASRDRNNTAAASDMIKASSYTMPIHRAHHHLSPPSCQMWV
jgi:hypothetical protein